MLCSSWASAEVVQLKNVDTGEVSGPYKHGEILSIGTNRYVVLLGDSKVSVKSQLEQIVFPEIQFRQTDLRDVVSFLREASIKLDPNGQGVNFILVPLKVETAGGGTSIQSPKYPRVTMNIKDVKLKDVLSLLHSATGFEMRIQSNAIVIRPPKPAKR